MIRKRTGSGNLDQTFTEGFVSIPLERHSIFGTATYDITENVSAYVQTNYSNVVVRQRGGLPPAVTVWQAPIPVNAATPIPAALQTLLNSRAVVTTGTPPPAAGTTGPTLAVEPVPGAGLQRRHQHAPTPTMSGRAWPA